jgi:hypothetical protein
LLIRWERDEDVTKQVDIVRSIFLKKSVRMRIWWADRKKKKQGNSSSNLMNRTRTRKQAGSVNKLKDKSYSHPINEHNQPPSLALSYRTILIREHPHFTLS